MRVLAAQFEDRDAASQVLDELRSRYGLGSDDAQIAPLGVATPSRAAATLLAGRFREQRVDEITKLIEGAGGTVIADVDEGWTKPTAVPASDRAELGGGRDERRRGEVGGLATPGR